MGTFKDTFKKEMAAQKAAKEQAKEARRKEREVKGPLIIRIMANAKNIAIGGFYSVAYLLVVYCAVLFVTLYLPSLLNVIVAYFDATTTLIITVECACLFFTAWIFVLSFVIVKKVTQIYKNGIKSLFHSNAK